MTPNPFLPLSVFHPYSDQYVYFSYLNVKLFTGGAPKRVAIIQDSTSFVLLSANVTVGGIPACCFPALERNIYTFLDPFGARLF